MLVDKVKSFCDEREITLAELERCVGLGNGTVARWDEKRPSVDRVAKVAEFFGVTVDELLKKEA